MYIGAVLFFFGMLVASFVGVVAGRYETGESIVRGRSRCDACGEPLSFFSLVPVLSYLAGRGRAQCCGSRISKLGPLSELLLGFLFVTAYVQFGLTYTLLFLLPALAVLLALVLYDLAHEILPPPFLFVFTALALVEAYVSASSYRTFGLVIATAALLSLGLFLLHVLSRGRAMGFADTPLVFGLSLLVGSAAVSGFIFSFWIGAIIGIGMLLARPRGQRLGVAVPFAPFLAAGFLLALFTSWNPFILVSEGMMRLMGA